MNKHDFIVIGGGICGLQIGALCSMDGDVALFEKTAGLGGRARVTVKNGFKMDWGAHPVRFGKKSSIAQTLREIGTRDLEWLDPGSPAAYLADGSREEFPSGLAGLLKSKMVPKLKFLKMYIAMKKWYKKDPEGFRATSIDDFVKETDLDKRLVKFLEISSAAMQVNPFMERSSIGELFNNMREVMRKGSVKYPRGGWNDIIAPLSSKIEENGKIYLSKPVKRIIVEEKNAIGVELLDGSRVLGKRVICTIPVQELITLLDPALLPDSFRQNCKGLRCTSGISIDFCLSREVADESLVFFEDPLGFGFCPTNMGADVAPEGKSIMYFFAPFATESILDASRKEKARDSLERRILSIYPQIKNHVEIERTLFHEMVDGVEISVDQHGGLRPRQGEHDINNLFLTGDSIGGQGAGGDIGHTSVRECYQRIRDGHSEKS